MKRKILPGSGFKTVLGIFALVILMAGSGKVSSWSAEAAPEPEEGKARVRVVTMKGAYQDHPLFDDFDPISILLGQISKTSSFAELADVLNTVGDDDSIAGVFLDLSDPYFSMNLAQLSEVRRHVQRLRDRGKKTVAWIELADAGHLAVASACDEVFMADMGMADFPSLSLSALHFRDAMDLLGVRASVAREGAFKGAIEPFTRSEMSDELRGHYAEMLGQMNGALIKEIATGRKTTPEAVREWQKKRLFTAKEAAESGMVDRLAPYGTQRELAASSYGKPVDWITPPKKQQKQMSFFDLMARVMGGRPEAKPSKPVIAVLHLDGQIIDGEEEMPGYMVSGPSVKEIQALRDDPNIKGVVVRINSPGGSATASEAIRQGLQRLAEDKPVVVSMGALAASGGYWITCIDRPIYAEPGTITGSIGVFAMKLSFGPLMNRVGLKVEHVALDSAATAFSLDRSWTDAEVKRIEAVIEDIYDKFLDRVSASRDLPRERLREIAEGRIWSGGQAQTLGLVDELGGLDTALKALAKQAGMAEEPDVVHRPKKKSFFEMLDLFGEGSVRASAVQGGWPLELLKQAGFNMAAPWQFLREGLAGRTVQVWALLPVDLRIR